MTPNLDTGRDGEVRPAGATAIPASRRTARWVVAALLLPISFAVVFVSQGRGVNVYDEGLVVFGAMRILHGEVPYRDFWGMYAPGQFYVLAGLFKLIAPSIVVERIWDIAVRAGIAGMALLWARRLGSGRYALAAGLAVLLILAGIGFHGFPVFPSLLFALISAFLVLQAMQSGRPARWLFAAGLAAAAAALFRHDMGCYLAIAEVVAVAWYGLTKPVRGELEAAPRLWPALAAYAAGVILLAVPVAIYLCAEVPLRDLWFNLFLVPATVYPKVRSLPFPPLPDPAALWFGTLSLAAFTARFSIYFPLLIGPIGIVSGALMLRAARAHDPQAALRALGILLLGLLTLLLYIKGIVRISGIHVVQSLVPATILFFALIARLDRVSRTWRLTALGIAIPIGVALAGGPASVALRNAAGHLAALHAIMTQHQIGVVAAFARLCAPQPDLERLRCHITRDDDVRAIRYIRSHTRPDEPIYTGVPRHDRIFVNNIMFYFLAERPAATKWHELHPGVQTTAAIQHEMIRELSARQARHLVLSSEWQNANEPNQSTLASGVTLLDDYINAHFDKVEVFGPVSIWRRK